MDLLSYIVQENSGKIQKSSSVKEVNSLPELGTNNLQEKFCRPSKSLPALVTPMASETSEWTEDKAEMEKKESHHLMEVASDTDSTTPVYSDDFDESSIDETQNEVNAKDEDNELCEKVMDGIKDVKKVKQKLNSPQQKVLSSAVETLEELLKRLKEDIVNTDETEVNLKEEAKEVIQQESKTDFNFNTSKDCSVAPPKEFKKSLEEKDAIIEDLETKLHESAATVDERSQVVEKLLNRLLVSTNIVHFSVFLYCISIFHYIIWKILIHLFSGCGRSIEPSERRSCSCV